MILIGNHTKDPELRFTQTGIAVATFTLAVNRQFVNSSTGKRDVDFINCVAWQKTAEFIANYFSKGQAMALEGRLQVRSYEDSQGNKRWITEVVAEHVEFVGSHKDRSTEARTSQKEEPFLLGEEITFDEADLPF